MGVCRSTVRYVNRPEDPVNVLMREELNRLSSRHRRYGTPRMTELVRRKGYNAKSQFLIGYATGFLFFGVVAMLIVSAASIKAKSTGPEDT